MSFSDSYLLNRPNFGNFKEPPALSKEDLAFKIAGFNLKIRSSSDKSHKDPKYLWEKRRSPIVALIEKDRPAVLGLCETDFSQVSDLQAALISKKYQYVGYSSVSFLSYHVLDSGDEEFIGVFYNQSRIDLIDSQCHLLGQGKKCAMILVEGRFLDRKTGCHFVVLASHFDGYSLEARDLAAQLERDLIEKLEGESTPWFSLGDRNWFSRADGQASAQEYTRYLHIVDFRDQTRDGHFGPMGTFPGQLDLPEQFAPLITSREEGLYQIEAETLDVGFRSKDKILALNSYTYTGEFDPHTYALLPNGQQGILSEKNLISDHYYFGGTFRFVEDSRKNHL